MKAYGKSRRILLCFAVTLAAILYVDHVCISQSQHLIGEELQLSKKQMGLALTVFGVAYGLFEVPGGWLADRFGPRRVLTGGVTWWSFFTLATGWARSLASFVFGSRMFDCPTYDVPSAQYTGYTTARWPSCLIFGLSRRLDLFGFELALFLPAAQGRFVFVIPC